MASPSSPPCDACGLASPDGSYFCGYCGTRLPSAATAVRTSGSVLVPLEQRRIVTVLFVDVVGYTAAAADADPEDLRQLQSSYFKAARTVIERCGGTVEKYIGDAVMACFGAPIAHEDDTCRAVTAALQLRDALRGQLLPGDRPMLIRAGVATGEALVDLRSDPGTGQGMVAGDVVNLACRLEQGAAPGSVLADGPTQRATVDHIEYAAATALHLDGRPDSVPCWTAVRTKPQRPDRPGGPPLVGRSAQVEALTGALADVVRDRSPRLVTVLGDAGLGKSRLVREVAARAGTTAAPMRWLFGHCPPYGESVTFWALAEVVKTAAGVLDSDAPEPAWAKLRAAVSTVLQPDDVPGVVERLSPLLGLGAGSPSADEARAAWTRYLLAIAEAGPLALVIEDLHWADDGLLDFLEGLLGAASGVPLLLIVTARPQFLDRRPEWGRRGAAGRDIALRPLDEAQTADLVATLLGGTLLTVRTRQRVVDSVGGNPLYAEEYVRMLADSGALSRRPGAAGPAEDDLHVPQSVQGVIASRLDLLTPVERAVVSAAAVVGHHFWAGAVAAVAAAELAVVAPVLATLVRRELIRRRPASTVDGEAEYEFQHVLVRDVAYGQIPRSLRADQHRRAADWLDEMTAGRGDDIAELLAHHRVAAYDLVAGRSRAAAAAAPYADPARRALIAAAERAMRLHALPAARGYVDRALSLWPADVDPPGRWRAVRLAAEVCFLCCEDEFYAAEGPRQLAEVSAALLGLGEVREAARAETVLGQAEWYRADPAAAFRSLQRAVDLLAAEPPSAQKAAAYAELGRLHMLAHHHDDAIAAAGTARAMALTLGLPEVATGALVTIGTARYLSGDPGGIADQETAVGLARRHRLRALHRAANNLAVTLQEEGQLRRSYALIEESAEVARRAGLSLTAKFSGPEEVMRAYFAGDWDTALAVAGGWLGRLGDTPHPWEVHLRALSAWLRLMRGAAAADVESDVLRALELARRGGVPQLLRPALAHAMLCRIITGDIAGDLSLAIELYDELDDGWRGDPASASREWIHLAVRAAARLDARTGGARVATIVGRLEQLPRPTLWVQAALLTGRAQLDVGRPAADLAARAVEIYVSIGDESDTALAQLQAVRVHLAAGLPERAADYAREARAFGRRNRAPLMLAELADAPE